MGRMWRNQRQLKAICVLLILAMTLGLLPGAAWAEGNELAGSGTAEDPHLLADAEDLKTFRDMVNAEDSSSLCARLTADIDLGSEEWTPIYSKSGCEKDYVTTAYAGVFDGDGHTIRGLSINATTANQGLFSVINGATVKNLNVKGSVASSNNYVGGIVGKVQQGTIENCSFRGTVTTTKSGGYAGGITGTTVAQTTQISGCVNTGSVSGGCIGGIAGYAKFTTVKNCYNTGKINGTGNTGGIVGQSMNKTTVENCYSIGEVSSTDNAGGIAGFNGVTDGIRNCYWTQPDDGFKGGTVSKDETSAKISSVEGLADKLGDVFTTDADGNVILKWQTGAAPAPKDPKITITGSSDLYMTNSGTQPTGTLTVTYQDINAIPVVWNIASGEDVITLNSSENADENNSTQIVSTQKPGKATVEAKTEDGTYSDTIEITVWPFVTSVKIEGTVAVGQTVKAKISVLGGEELDYETFPVKVQWKYLTGDDYSAGNAGSSSYKTIPEVTGREFVIPENLVDNYLSFTYRYQNEDKSPSSPILVKPAGTVDPDPQPPESDKTLDEALKGYTMYPICGKDTNVNRVLEGYLAEKGFTGYTSSVKSIEEVYGGAEIGEDGAITYFYADPNTTPAMKMGSYKVTFTLSKGAETLDYEDVPVILYWDVDKVKAAMSAEILDKVDIDTTVPATKDFALPKIVDDKKWTLISWNSSDDAVIAISEENQGMADTLFAPYVAKVKQGDTDKTVTLTATFTFQLTNDVTGQEQPITMTEVFTVNVPALDGTEQERIQRELQEKLERGFAAKGLTDAVTGEALVAENGVYTASHDIQFPTTRDFGVDGKLYPIGITSSNESVLKAPDVNNAARVEVYRPGVGERDAEAVVTVTMRDKNTNVTASKEFSIRIKALTQAEIDAELALMEKVKANYFEGIKGDNATKDNVRTDLAPFQEVYEENGQLVWVRDSKERVGHGIVPTPIEGWEERELWRLFKSSNANVISHENLLVDRQKEAKAVTITSYLSSETLGRYGQLYQEHPEQYPKYAQLADLYYQEVTTDTVAQPAQRQTRMAKAASNTMIVRGIRDPESAVPVEEKLDVAFALTGLDGETWILITFSDLEENLTVYDLFEQALTEQGYTWERQKGTYVVSVTTPDGETLSELDFGRRSGWMYRVNGVLQDVYMGACPLHNGDKVQVFYTKDASEDDPNWTWPFEDSTGATAGGGTTNTTVTNSVKTVQVVQNEENSTYVITLPTGEQKESQLVTLPVGKSGQLVVIVYPDGTEKVVKKAVVENGQTKLLLDTNATVKLMDYANNYSDVVDGAWYNSAVDFVTGRKLFSGVSDTAFAPDVVFSRAMAATVLYRLAEPDAEALDNPFHDVAKDAWYAQSVAWAANVGVVGGYGNETFGPEDSVTREQFVAMLYRFAKSENGNLENNGSLQQFTDEDTVSDWAKEAMTWAADAGIINGLSDKTLNPSGTTTRAQAAVMLQRFVEFMVH